MLLYWKKSSNIKAAANHFDELVALRREKKAVENLRLLSVS
jgi:hypothetical protein